MRASSATTSSCTKARSARFAASRTMCPRWRPALQLARVYFRSAADENAQPETARALRRAAPFLRRHLGQRIRLRRVPELEFFYDESIARNDRIEQILRDLKAERHEPIGDDDPGDQ